MGLSPNVPCLFAAELAMGASFSFYFNGRMSYLKVTKTKDGLSKGGKDNLQLPPPLVPYARPLPPVPSTLRAHRTP